MSSRLFSGLKGLKRVFLANKAGFARQAKLNAQQQPPAMHAGLDLITALAVGGVVLAYASKFDKNTREDEARLRAIDPGAVPAETESRKKAIDEIKQEPVPVFNLASGGLDDESDLIEEENRLKALAAAAAKAEEEVSSTTNKNESSSSPTATPAQEASALSSSAGHKSNQSSKEGSKRSNEEDEDELDFSDIILPKRGKPAQPDDYYPGKLIAEVRESTLDTLVFDPEYDVVLDIYSPTCRACKQFMPVLEAVAQSFADCGVGSIRVAKMDGINNYRPGLLPEPEESLFPNIKLYKAGTDKQRDMVRAAIQIQELMDYRKARLEAKKEGRAPPPPPSFTREQVQPVGVTWNMQWKASQLSTDAMIDWIHENSAVKFDAAAVKARVRHYIPQVEKKLEQVRMEITNGLGMPDERISALTPCADEWKKVLRLVQLSDVGMNDDMEAIPKAVGEWDKCLKDPKNIKEVREFWTVAKSQAELVLRRIGEDSNDK